MRIFHLFLLAISWLPLQSQHYYFRQMPSDIDGNVQRIHIIYQDLEQLIWLGTENGLYAYDGRTYRPTPRPDGLKKSVTSIAQNAQGELWAGYEDGLIHIISGHGLHDVIVTDSFRGFPVSDILFKEKGSAFICTYGAGLWEYRDGLLTSMDHESLKEISDIYDAVLDVYGRLWLATDHGIWSYQHEPEKRLENIGIHQGLPDEIVTRLKFLSKDHLAIGFYDQGLGILDIGEKKFTSAMDASYAQGSIINLVRGDNSDVWYCTERTVGKFNFHERPQAIRLPEMIKNRIDDILVDRTGNLWIASGNQLFVANTQLEQIEPGIDRIQAVTRHHDDLWIGCENGLFQLHLQDQSIAQHLNGMALNILSIYKDDKGILWLGTFGEGLFIYDPVKRKIKNLTEAHGIANNSILNIDGAGSKLWLATLGGITEIEVRDDPFNGNLSIIGFQEKYQFPPGYVYDVYVAKDEVVWFGTDGKGLHWLDESGLHSMSTQVKYSGEDSFDIKTIYSITSDLYGHIWVSTTQGNTLKLNMKGDILEHIPSSHGSLNTLVTSGHDEIVIIREGVIQVNNPHIGILNFTSSSGLEGFSPNINSTAIDEDGSVWIADADQILQYIPSASDTLLYVPLQFVDLAPSLLEQDVWKLKQDSNFLDLRFTGLWYADPSRVRYRYMLKGHDQDWIETKEGRAVYSKLGPGNYTFIVEGSHNDDFSKAHALQKEIVVLPPFYLTWWFIIGVIIFLTGLGYLLFRLRIQRLKHIHRLEKEKTTLQLHAIQAQVNPHFLFNSFNTLSGIIEEDQRSAVKYVDQLSGFFRGVLVHRNEELIPLSEEINILRHYTYILKKRHGSNVIIKENFTFTGGLVAPLTLQMLVENAIKHNKITHEKPLQINIEINDRYITVTNPVQPKIQVMTESTGFGLSSLLTRYQYLTSDKIEIQNDGNTFTVRIPVIHNHEVS